MSMPLFAASASPAPHALPAEGVVKDVDLANFMAEVIEESKLQPVIVDFHSPRSALSKQQSPILEKLVRAAKGAVKLVRADVERNLEIAQQMGVQSVPATFGFFQGRPVDGFMGVQSEAQIKAWLDHLIKATGATAPAGDGIASALAQAAEFFAANDLPSAQSIYAEILEVDPTNAAAYAGGLRCLIALGDTVAARQMLDAAPAAMAKDKAFDTPRTALELAEQAAQMGGANAAEPLLAKLAADANDHQSRFDLALVYYAAGKREEAVDQLLDIVRRKRNWNEDAARKQLVKLFEAFGPTDPLTLSGRKRLSSILFS